MKTMLTLSAVALVAVSTYSLANTPAKCLSKPGITPITITYNSVNPANVGFPDVNLNIQAVNQSGACLEKVSGVAKKSVFKINILDDQNWGVTAQFNPSSAEIYGSIQANVSGTNVAIGGNPNGTKAAYLCYRTANSVWKHIDQGKEIVQLPSGQTKLEVDLAYSKNKSCNF